jgi:hypothetical protein
VDQGSLRRPGLRGLIAVRIPAASDLVGIYEDVGAVLITFGTSIVPSFRFVNLCIRWGGNRRYPNTTGYYPFERKIFPPVSST